MASLKRRGNTWYAQYYNGSKQVRVSLDTESYQLAKDKLRQLESAHYRGEESPLPAKTPIARLLERYAEHIRTIRTATGAQNDIYYLLSVFGPVCEALTNNSNKATVRARRAKHKDGQDRRRKPGTIEVTYIEQVSTAHISDFITAQVRSRRLKPQTANRYRAILRRFFNWAMKEQGIRMPGNANPVSAINKYKEDAPNIRFLDLKEIDKQLEALEDSPQLQTMVAVLIYTGLRREELLWLTIDDIDLKAQPHGVIRVRAKTIMNESWQPKTKDNRAIPISSQLRYWLDRYAPRPSAGRWYFPSPQTANRYDINNFSRELRTANENAGLKDRRWSCLVYRHTFGSILAQNNISHYRIAKLMGNSPEICIKHYAALVPEHLADAVEFPRLAKENAAG
jgi:integrase